MKLHNQQTNHQQTDWQEGFHACCAAGKKPSNFASNF
jgi:hypothetical protein